MDSVDGWLEQAYEDRSGDPEDPGEGFLYWEDDETEEPQSDEERDRIQAEWDRFGDEQDLMS